MSDYKFKITHYKSPHENDDMNVGLYRYQKTCEDSRRCIHCHKLFCWDCIDWNFKLPAYTDAMCEKDKVQIENIKTQTFKICLDCAMKLKFN